MFGRSHLPTARQVYGAQLRPKFSKFGRRYWDRRIRLFTNPRHTFFFRGTSGTFARLMNVFINKVLRLRPGVNALLTARSVEQQRLIYEQRIRDRLWARPMRFAMNRDATLSLLGVPRAQRRQVEQQYDGKIANFVRDCLETVLTQIPLSDNYFWRVLHLTTYEPKQLAGVNTRHRRQMVKADLAQLGQRGGHQTQIGRLVPLLAAADRVWN